jgi:hypothetical protein
MSLLPGKLSMKLLALIFCLTLVTYCASAQKRTRPKTVVMQGICGTVIEKRGNHMPSPDSPRRNSAGTPVERDVLIFPLLNNRQIQSGQNGFIKSVGDVKPLKTVKSGKDGTFCVDLPAGRYSVVIREPEGLYANLFDSQNNINPVTVEKGKKATATVEISHQAVF